MNAARLSSLLADGVAAAEEHLAALEDAYRAALKTAGIQASRRFERFTVDHLTADATNPGWTPPENDQLLNQTELAADANRRAKAARQGALKAVLEPVLADIGIAYDLRNPFVARLADKLGARAADLGDAIRNDIAKTILASYQDGLSVAATAKAIRAAVNDISPVRAAMLARTDLIGLANGASLVAAQLVSGDGQVGFKQWLATEDERTRESHADADGQVVPVDQPFEVGGEQLMYPGDPDGSDAEVCNCFPAGTLVAGTVSAAMRAPYRGTLVTISTRRGRRLTGTPNHPILTASGWKALGSITEGDHLICASFEQWPVPGAPDVENAPVRIEEVFNAVAQPGLGPRVRAADVNFHGDRPDGDVDVVWADGLLELSGTPTGFKPSQKLNLAIADKLPIALSASRFGGELRGASFAASACEVSARGKRAALIVGEGAHTQEHGFGLTAALDASFRESPLHDSPGDTHSEGHSLFRETLRIETDDLVDVHVGSEEGPRSDSRALQVVADRFARDAERSGDLAMRLPRGITRDDVVAIDSFAFQGDVFTVTTEQGYYIANGICVANCRCTLTYLDASDVAGTAGDLAAAGVTPTDAVASRGRMDESPDATLTADVTVTVSEDAAPEAEMAAAPVKWRAILCVEGEPSQDGPGLVRMLKPGGGTWRDLPLSLGVMFETPHSDEAHAEVCGRIDSIYRDAADARIIWGEGEFNADEVGAKAAEMVGNLSLRGVSIDPYVALLEVTEPPVTDGAAGEPLEVQPTLLTFAEYVIGGATICPFQALESATISIVPDAEGEMVQPRILTASCFVLTVETPGAVSGLVSDGGAWIDGIDSLSGRLGDLARRLDEQEQERRGDSDRLRALVAAAVDEAAVPKQTIERIGRDLAGIRDELAKRPRTVQFDRDAEGKLLGLREG